MPMDDMTTLPVASVHDYVRAAHDLADGRFGDGAVFLAGESAARLTEQRIDDFSDRLNELITEFFAPDAAQWESPIKYSFRWILMPVDTAPDDDVRAQSTTW
ncbi:hypothetical protein FHX74_001646 [Friedmanniella endophytica]|uniref:Uncharacterized protein n=1 Tax=Microlunatus kandeliicorticis TaxID=1759536 RepID=A0A7W3P5J5_9ACTN|nr:hypothetical protein [Microlunatus kandeliicorticis]MBA8794041.1 hypothetical protein [Microlunatus kandeliicorticis]